MAGEVNGTVVVVNNATGAIVGQGDFTHTYGGQLIETTNKSSGDNVTYMSGENSGKQHVFAGDFVYNSDAQFRATRDAVFSVASEAYTLTYVSDATTDESFTGQFFPTDMSDTISQGAAIRTALSFKSSGVVTRTAAVT